MRIIRSGNQAKVPEWAGKELECKNCGCKFMLESGDVVKSESSGYTRYMPWRLFGVNCPSCQCGVSFLG